MGELFHLYCDLVLPQGMHGNIAMPFFHLKSEGFWHLIPKPGHEPIVNSKRLRSVSLVQEHLLGAKADDDLHHCLSTVQERDLLRVLLIETHFHSDFRDILLEQGQINNTAFQYSQTLLKEANHLRESLTVEDSYHTKVRSQGFRRAIVQAYSHRCALCGLRVLTPDGRTAVVGAHIVPWHVSYNDDPTNGLALCRLCHWAFDIGLLGISDTYKIKTSPRLNAQNNMAGHLLTLEKCDLIKPRDDNFWPDLKAIKWHLKEVFRRH